MKRDKTSIPRTTKRIGSLRFFIKHRGTTRKNFGTASKQRIDAWKTQLDEELKLRETLKKERGSLGNASTLQRSARRRGPPPHVRPFPVGSRDDAVRAELAAKSLGSLLALSRAILSELKHRGVIRSGNAPAGDYAELLVQRATNGELAPSSQKSWDVLASTGDRLQVKARVVTDPREPGERQLSVFRSWDFDAAVIVLFDDEFRVWRAARVRVDVVKDDSRFVEHVRGHRILATDKFLDRGDDWTELLRAIEG